MDVTDYEKFNLTLKVTVLDGDVDLYMACTVDPTGDATGTPSLRHHTALSIKSGTTTDIIRVLPGAPESESAPLC